MNKTDQESFNNLMYELSSYYANYAILSAVVAYLGILEKTKEAYSFSSIFLWIGIMSICIFGYFLSSGLHQTIQKAYHVLIRAEGRNKYQVRFICLCFYIVWFFIVVMPFSFILN
uniref:hypothetical protein n=2 Tax=unclassified Acinetobacter TaxID=196816 RepID=UPI001C09B956